MSSIGLFSPSLNPYDSYGVIAAHLTKHLSAMGVTVNALGFDKSATGYLPPCDGSLELGWPSMFAAFPKVGGPRVAITMWESSICPPDWTPILNEMDAVITPSTFCADMFHDAGVTVPLYMFPLGVDEIYQPVERAPSEKTTFIAFMDRGRRKGGLVALHAFLKAFGSDPRYQLILKMRAPGQQVILFDNPNIRLIQQDMSEQELYDLYARCDCMIAANSGEGFGLLPRNFAATGGIALATDWGGTKDDIAEWGLPIPYELGQADWSGLPMVDGLDLGEWANPCVDELAAMLTDVAQRKQMYLDDAMRKAGNVHKLYSWPHFALSVFDVWRGLA